MNTARFAAAAPTLTRALSAFSTRTPPRGKRYAGSGSPSPPPNYAGTTRVGTWLSTRHVRLAREPARSAFSPWRSINALDFTCSKATSPPPLP